MFKEMRRQNIRVSVTVIQARWDWGASYLLWAKYFPWIKNTLWAKSNKEIFQEYIPEDLISFIKVSGLHNVTLGKDSKNLAKMLSKFFLDTGFSLAFLLLPQLPVFANWFASGVGIVCS